MIRKLFISTAICSALISSPVLAAGNTGQDQGNPQTTGQQRSGPNDAGGQASTSRSTNADQASATNSDQANGPHFNRQHFNDMDRSGDGRLDEEELNRYGSPAAGPEQSEDSDRGERLLEMYDQNDDDELTREELERGPRSEHEDDSGW